jgi:hypothetical protein
MTVRKERIALRNIKAAVEKFERTHPSGATHYAGGDVRELFESIEAEVFIALQRKRK